MKKKILYWIISIVIIQFPVSVLAAEGGDVTVVPIHGIDSLRVDRGIATEKQGTVQ